MLELLQGWQDEAKEHETKEYKKPSIVKAHIRHYEDHDTFIEEHIRLTHRKPLVIK